jgi:hypothetical protein
MMSLSLLIRQPEKPQRLSSVKHPKKRWFYRSKLMIINGIAAWFALSAAPREASGSKPQTTLR